MSILNSPESQNGRKKYTSLITLTLQNSALILIMHHSRTMAPVGDHRYFTSTVVFLSELLKLAVSLALAIHETSLTLAPSTPLPVLLEQISHAVFAGDGWKLAAPAALYTMQNLLLYVAVGNLDAVQMQVLYQLKILTTAVFTVVLLRRPLGPMRWAALVVLTIGVCVVCVPSVATVPGEDSVFLHDPTDQFFPRSLHELGQASPELYQPQPWHLTKRVRHAAAMAMTNNNNKVKRSATYEGITEDLLPPEPMMNFSVGITAVLIAAAVSGLTGVYFEKLLKESPVQASLWIRNVQLSFYSLIAAFFGGIIYQDGSGIAEHGFFEGYNWVVWSAVGLQAAGGLVASLVIRDADNIVKNFATSISIVCSFLASVLVFDFVVTWTFLMGTALVLLATWMYALPDETHRRKQRSSGNNNRPAMLRPGGIPSHLQGDHGGPKNLRIVSLEKAAVVAAESTGSSPTAAAGGKIPLDVYAALKEGAGRPHSPMLSRVSSFKRED